MQDQAARPDPSLLKPRRAGLNAFLVYGLEIIFVLALLLTPVYFLVKAGILQFPGSSVLYHPPQPVRVVQTSSVFTTADLARLVESRLRTSASHGVRDAYPVTFSEEELTGALRGIINPLMARTGWKGKNVQVTLLPEEADVSGHWVKSLFHVDLLMRGRITFDAHTVRYQPTAIQIGEMTLSQEQLHWLAQKVTGQALGDWAFSFGELTLAKVRTLPRQLELSFLLPQA